MSSNYTQRIQAQKTALEKAKEARSRAEATQEQLLKQQEQVETECWNLGVEPEELKAKIGELDTSIQENIAKADELIPEQFRVVTR